MAFSDSIAALLETYSNCATLLKAYKHDANGEDGNVKVDAQNKHLRKSLKADRAMVERAYSIRLAELGSRLKRGDARSISAVDGILKKLKAAISSLLRASSSKQTPALNYDALRSLSNSSRIEAIKTVDNLARRLGGSSRTSRSVVSMSSKHMRASSPSSRARRQYPPLSNSASSLPKKSRSSNPTASSVSNSSQRRRKPPLAEEEARVSKQKSSPKENFTVPAEVEVSNPTASTVSSSGRPRKKPLLSEEETRMGERHKSSPKGGIPANFNNPAASAVSSSGRHKSKKPPRNDNETRRSREKLPSSKTKEITVSSEMGNPTASSVSSSNRRKTKKSPPTEEEAREASKEPSTPKQPQRTKVSPVPAPTPPPPSPPPPPPPPPAEHVVQIRSHPRNSQFGTAMRNRMSFMSFASGSTKLGEMSDRKWLAQHTIPEANSDEYDVPVLYPLKPYRPEVKEKKFLGLFGRRRQRNHDDD
ncbi:hypothetical protein QBC32DRAFT_316212 [Pseudoneurospora amorphoporcata]|uniref:Uncharacterized protein n=1 Tax=Pseudoneurospora amorphoporcata TaxID=241081 RepID=A0AAN6NQP8_9PEZI|nr:hypothetical protein QBC32DRAFT_316212 [Pseudoneurospora amorphoporcata]